MGRRGHGQSACASWGSKSLHVSPSLPMPLWEVLLHAESALQTAQLKSHLGKLLVASSKGIQGAHWRSPGQPCPTCVTFGAWARHGVGSSPSLAAGLSYWLAGELGGLGVGEAAGPVGALRSDLRAAQGQGGGGRAGLTSANLSAEQRGLSPRLPWEGVPARLLPPLQRALACFFFFFSSS